MFSVGLLKLAFQAREVMLCDAYGLLSVWSRSRFSFGEAGRNVI